MFQKIKLDLQKFANTINNAEKWQSEILETITQNSLTGGFIKSNVKWLSAKTFNFTAMSMPGYSDHTLSAGYNSKDITQTNVPFTVLHDRDVEIFIDKRQVDESNQTASIQNITREFIIQQGAPELDVLFYVRVAAAASTASLDQSFAIASYTTANVYPRLKEALRKGKLRLYSKRGGLIMFVNSTIMDLLEQSDQFTRKIEMTQVGPEGSELNTRITKMDGVTIVEVIDDERFWNSFNFTNGFVPATGAFRINFLIASMETVSTVAKIESLYMFAPGQHTRGDGYLYQNRAHWDTLVFPNNKTASVDSIFVELDTVPNP
jgi:hypothetical protein